MTLARRDGANYGTAFMIGARLPYYLYFLFDFEALIDYLYVVSNNPTVCHYYSAN